MTYIDKSIHNLEKSIKLLDNIETKVKENKPIKIEFKPVIKVEVQYGQPPKKKPSTKKKGSTKKKPIKKKGTPKKKPIKKKGTPKKKPGPKPGLKSKKLFGIL